jgi:anaerobic ribonucleoside-triphosphate reductase activating protein
VVARCRTWAAEGDLDGITISGGEPFDQPVGLLALLSALCEWRTRERLNFDLLAYSGYSERRLRAHHARILDRLDAVISEPYMRAKAPGGRWRGSANQRIVPLTPRGCERYTDIGDDPPQKPAVQIMVDEEIWIVGVPRPGDLDRVETALRGRGVVIGAPSWR